MCEACDAASEPRWFTSSEAAEQTQREIMAAGVVEDVRRTAHGSRGWKAVFQCPVCARLFVLDWEFFHAGRGSWRALTGN